MKIATPILMLFLAIQLSFSQSVYINEINYTGPDTGVEIFGPQNTNLSGWSLVFYEGTNRKVYKTVSLSGVIYGEEVYWFGISGISTGHPKGAAIALVNNFSNVVDFVSYGGSFVAKDGLAAGLSSENIGIEEADSNPGKSLQKGPAGWEGPKTATPGKGNANKTLSVVKNQINDFKLFSNPVYNGQFSIASSSNSTKKIELYAINGQRVLVQNVHSHQPINVVNFATGVYILRVEEDGRVATRKLMIN